MLAITSRKEFVKSIAIQRGNAASSLADVFDLFKRTSFIVKFHKNILQDILKGAGICH